MSDYPKSNVTQMSGKSEREVIVEWLRDFANYDMSPDGYGAICLVADCIERGQHLSATPMRGRNGWCMRCKQEKDAYGKCPACKP